MKVLWLLGWYLVVCVLLPDALEKGVAAIGLGGGMVVTMLTSAALAYAALLEPVLM